ncbi:hypothetical protein MKW94_000428, partial [Papaver nudicaule]|nr:hypothetical protein [Papaver nudicaule]
IQVDMNSKYVQPVELDNSHSSEITENDEENPPESSEDTKKEASSKTSHKSIFMSYFGRGDIRLNNSVQSN